jgi:hypothetical protein
MDVVTEPRDSAVQVLDVRIGYLRRLGTKSGRRKGQLDAACRGHSVNSRYRYFGGPYDVVSRGDVSWGLLAHNRPAHVFFREYWSCSTYRGPETPILPVFITLGSVLRSTPRHRSKAPVWPGRSCDDVRLNILILEDLVCASHSSSSSCMLNALACAAGSG